MSVLIKGMKMPKNCTECPLNEHEMTFGCAVTGRRYNWGIQERLPNCPLVEIPADHGKLVEGREAVRTIVDNAYLIQHDNKIEFGMSCFDVLMTIYEKAPALLEAEV